MILYIALPRDCSVDNRDCEEDCGTPLQDGSYCRCPENQTLIGTSCVCKYIVLSELVNRISYFYVRVYTSIAQSTYFSIYGEVYEDSDIFIHHPLYHVGPFEIMCNSLDENAIAEQGQWIIQAFNSSTTVAFNGGTVFLSNSSVNASATLRGVESFGQATLTVDQPVEGYFTCIVNNVSHTIRVITGGCIKTGVCIQWVNECTCVHMYIHAYIHTCMHTYIHTVNRKCSRLNNFHGYPYPTKIKRMKNFQYYKLLTCKFSTNMQSINTL